MNTRPPLTLLLTLTLGAAFAAPQAARGSDARDPGPEARERERQHRRQQEADAAIRRSTEQFAAAAKETSDQLGRLHDQAEQFQKRVAALLINDDGKRLAMNRDAFMDYLRIQGDPAVSLADVAARKAKVESIADGLKKELAQPSAGYVSSPQQQQDVLVEKSWAASKAAKLSEQTDTLNALLGAVPRDADLSGAKTLEVVIRDYKLQDIERWRQAQSRGRDEAGPQATQVMVDAARLAELQRAEERAKRLLQETHEQMKLQRHEFEEMLRQRDAEARAREAKAEQEYKDRLAEIDRQMKVADAERHVKNVDASVKAANVAATADRKLLVQKCKDPEVQRRLAPFLAKGYWQPEGQPLWHSGGGGRDGVEKLPMSLSGLRKAGALNQTPEGLSYLICIGSSKNSAGDREVKWGFSNNTNWNHLDAKQKEEVSQAQKDLVELGEVLVEQGLLAP